MCKSVEWGSGTCRMSDIKKDDVTAVEVSPEVGFEYYEHSVGYREYRRENMSMEDTSYMLYPV